MMARRKSWGVMLIDTIVLNITEGNVMLNTNLAITFPFCSDIIFPDFNKNPIAITTRAKRKL
jgi:hypothetical protein